MADITAPPAALRDDLRSLWMLKPGLTFLNHGSFGAVAREVFEVQNQWRRRIEAEPVEMIGRRGQRLIGEAKQSVAARFGMRCDDFGFVTNATDGVNAALRSIELKPGDELLTTNHVYNAVRQAMKQVARKAGASCREINIPLPVESPDQITSRVLESISPQTRLLVIDHVTSPTALVFPVKEIAAGCRARGVEVLVDGAHAPGMLPLEVEKLGVTYYAANLHKWVCSPKGTAFLWVSPDRQARVHPAVISHNLDQGFAKEFAMQGTRDLSAWLSAPAAISFLEKLGWDNVLSHNHQLATWAQQMLSRRWGTETISPRDGSMIGSMVTLRLPESVAKTKNANQLQQRLYDEFSLEQPLVGWNGETLIRVSCQVYNTAGDYEKLAEVIEELADEVVS